MKKQKPLNKNSEIDPLDGDLSEVIQNADWKKFSDYFHFAKKDKTITLRVSDDILKKFKKLAKKKETKYQKLVYEAMVQYIIREKAS
jgi:predicted DNA binding CopG/RHH family protein